MVRKKARPITCPECRGLSESRKVKVTQLDGRVTDGIERVNVECETCGSTGKVLAREVKACCCAKYAFLLRCPGCRAAKRGGHQIHVCEVETAEERAFAAKLKDMPSPARGVTEEQRKKTAHLDLGVGERSGQRGDR